MSWFRVLSRTVTEISEDPTRAYRLDLELTPIVVPGVPSYFTSTNVGGCEVGTWPLGSPGAGKLLVGFLAGRDNSMDYDNPLIVPSGNGVAPGSETCNALLDIAGTEWTYIQGAFGGDLANQSVTMTMAYRDSVAGEPQVIRWGGPGLIAGTARPRSHQVAIEGLSGAPTVTASASGSPMGAVMTSPSIVVPAAGYIFAGFGYRVGGPAEGGQAFTLSARAPAVDLTQGYAYGSFGPYSWFGYLHVDAGGTYDITLDRTAYSGSNWGRWWLMGFWPE